jgi:hypothetical protein
VLFDDGCCSEKESHKEMTKAARLSIEVIRDLEERLSTPLFQGVSVGATLTDFFVTNFLNASRLPGYWSATMDILRLCRYFTLGPRGCSEPVLLKEGRVLFTWLADTPRYNDLIAPVLAEFDPGQCNVVGGGASIERHLNPGVGFCTATQAIGSGIDRVVWRQEYARCRPAWHCILRHWIRDHHLPRRLFPQLACLLTIRSWQIAALGRFLDSCKPTAILTDSEHNSPWSCLVLAARHRGIPTVAMTHGVIYFNYGYTPLLSDVALCWGRDHRDQMIEQGVEPATLLITGCQRLKRTPSVAGNEVRERLGLPLNMPIVMLGTGPMEREEWRKLAFAFGEAFENHPGVTGVVRLHASESIEDCRTELARYPGIRLLENSSWTVEDSMAACDVVVIHNSGLGNDALVFKRLVVLLDVLALPLSNGRSLADKAGSPVAHSADELRQIVDRIFSDTAYRQELHRRAEEYVDGFCAEFGQDAARKAAAEVKRMAQPGPAGKMTTKQPSGEEIDV